MWLCSAKLSFEWALALDGMMGAPGIPLLPFPLQFPIP